MESMRTSSLMDFSRGPVVEKEETMVEWMGSPM